MKTTGMLKGILISPETAGIWKIELPHTIENIQKVLGVKRFDIAHIPEFGLDAFIDDEGLFNRNEDGSIFVTEFKESGIKLVGKILLTGVDPTTGETISIPDSFDIQRVLMGIETVAYKG